MPDLVLSTVHYGMFQLDSINREVDVDSKKFRNLVESMKKHGFKASHPLDVVERSNGKLKIRCGHNRLTAAKLLGIPVKYVISNDDSTIYELENAGPGGWKPSHYLDSFCKQGFKNYQILKDYINETGIGLGNAASMFYGDSAGSSNYLKTGRFQAGEFTIKDLTHPQDVKDIVLFMKGEPANVEWANSKGFVMAISRALRVTEFKKARFLDKVKTFPQILRKQKSVVDYLKHIEDIYNFKSFSTDRVNIAFLAEKVALARQKARFTKKEY